MSKAQIVWQDSEDIYKPIKKNLIEFIKNKNIQVYRVFIKDKALEIIEHHLQSNLKVEQGGILFGNAYEDEHLGIYVEINTAIPAPATIGSGAYKV